MNNFKGSIDRKPYVTMERFFEYNNNKESFQRLSLEEKIANYNERTKNIHFVRLSDSFFKRKRFKSSEEESEFFINYRNTHRALFDKGALKERRIKNAKTE